MQLVPTAPGIQTRHFDGHPIRVIEMDGRPWLVAMDLAGPLDTSRDVIRQRIGDMETSDVRVATIYTNKGSRQTTIVSESGAYQLIVQSRKPAAARLRKFICDWFVAFGRGELAQSPASLDPALVQALASIVQGQQALMAQMTEMTKAFALVVGGMPRPGAPKLTIGLDQLPAWTNAEHKRMRSAGYITCADLLARERGSVQHQSVSGGLTRRVLSWCKEKGLTPFYFCRGARKLIYVPEAGAKLVLRTGWSAQSAVLAEAQGEFFAQDGSLKPPTD